MDAQHREQVQQLEQDLLQAKGDLDAFEEELEENQKVYTAASMKGSRPHSQALESASAAREDADTARARIEELEQEVSEQQQTIEDLQDAKSSAEDRLATVESDTTRLSANVQQLEAQRSAWKKQEELFVYVRSHSSHGCSIYSTDRPRTRLERKSRRWKLTYKKQR